MFANRAMNMTNGLPPFVNWRIDGMRNSFKMRITFYKNRDVPKRKKKIQRSTGCRRLIITAPHAQLSVETVKLLKLNKKKKQKFIRCHQKNNTFSKIQLTGTRVKDIIGFPK